MPLFYFILKAGRRTIPLTDGEEFENQTGAVTHARAVARELMRNRETKTSHWRIQVCDDYLQPRHECLFADVDAKFWACGADLRTSVAAVARTTAAMNDAVEQIDASMNELRQTIRRIDLILSSRVSH